MAWGKYLLIKAKAEITNLILSRKLNTIEIGAMHLKFNKQEDDFLIHNRCKAVRMLFQYMKCYPEIFAMGSYRDFTHNNTPERNKKTAKYFV